MNASTEGGSGSSAKVWIGSTVMTALGLVLGSSLVLSGSFLRWQSDSVLGLYNESGWRFDNLISGDGKITFALGVLLTVTLLGGLIAQNKYLFMTACLTSVLALGFSIYQIVYIAARPGITGIGHGLYMVLGGSVACFLCSLGDYLMMAERHKDLAPEPAAAQAGAAE